MQNRLIKKGLGLLLFLMAYLGYLDILGDKFEASITNKLYLTLFLLILISIVYLIFEIRKQGLHKIHSYDESIIPKLNRSPNKANLFFFVILMVLIVVSALFVYPIVEESQIETVLMFCSAFLGIYGLSLFFRILV